MPAKYVTCITSISLSAAVTTQTEAWRKVEAEMKTLEEDRNKWQQQAGLLRDYLKKQKTLASSTVAKLTQQESENISLKKVHIPYMFNRY
jgi:septal ring factor EnvC (AmiA/AmiB activator)